MFSALPLALGQLGDRAILRLLVKSMLLTIALFALLAAASGWLLTGTNPCGIGPLDFSCEIRAGAGTLAAFLFVLAGFWFLFPAVAVTVIGIFADEAVDAVETRHYPDARGRDLPFGRSLAMGIRSGARVLGWNLLALPLYLILLVTGVGPFLLFMAVNAFALGRDLGEMVAARHVRGEALDRWLAASRLDRAVLGLGATLLFMIPFFNLLAPVLGAAMATHMFHRRRHG